MPSVKDEPTGKEESPAAADSCDGPQFMEISRTEEPGDEATGLTEHHLFNNQWK